MTHFYILDYIGHILYGDRLFYNSYKLINSIIKKISHSLEDTTMIIVSDHGMKDGKHTPYGFYSYNDEKLMPPKDITDFYKIVKKLISK